MDSTSPANPSYSLQATETTNRSPESSDGSDSSYHSSRESQEDSPLTEGEEFPPLPTDKQRHTASGASTDGSHHCSRESALGSQRSSRRSLGSVQSSAAGSVAGSNSTYEYGQEAFETYKLKVLQLCRDVGWGEPSEVERMKGGSYNRVIGLKFQNRECVLRIPREVMHTGDDLQRVTDLKDQVVVLRYVSEFLPVPAIMAFDSTINNALGSPYVLQVRARGKDLDKLYDTLPLAEKLQVATAMAELILKIESVKCDVPGRLAANVALPDTSTSPFDCVRNIEIGGFRITRNLATPAMPKMEKQSLTSLLRAMLDHRRPHPGDPYDWETEQCEQLKKIVLEMEAAGLVRTTDDENTIWH